jgi:hypothetical protein
MGRYGGRIKNRSQDKHDSAATRRPIGHSTRRPTLALVVYHPAYALTAIPVPLSTIAPVGAQPMTTADGAAV